jgi:transposase-like protein
LLIGEEQRMKRSRRKFTAEFKAKVALAAVKGNRTLSELAAQFDVHPNQITMWKKQLIENVTVLFAKDPAEGGDSEVQIKEPAAAGSVN